VRRLRPSRRLVVVLALALASPVLPVFATPLPDVVEAAVRTVPLGLGETVQELAVGEQLVGVTWDAGAPSVQVRWRTADGWTAWEEAEPDQAVDEQERAGTRPGTEPVWRPRGADLVAVRVEGTARGLELVGVGDGDVRAGGVTFGLPTADAAVHLPLLGPVRNRADWGADERMRRGAPAYASTVSAVVVHHTAGGNDYGPADVPARLRADYAYHVRSRGWSDLGYNLVVDRFGRLWEGRAGGIGRAVVGTHAQGFNTGTLGVSVMGDYTRAPADAAVVDALARVAAFAGRTWRFDPAGWVNLRSGGSPRYGKGAVVPLPRVHGHRDTGRTACPGSLYDQMQVVRDKGRQLLVGPPPPPPPPTLTALTITGAPVHAPEPLVVDARLSRDVPWAVVVHDAAGREVARTGGRSVAPYLRWDGLHGSAVGPTGNGPPPVPLPAAPGRYRWTVEFGDGVHPAQRRSEEFEVSTPLVGLPVP
jgi:hypothetical protein